MFYDFDAGSGGFVLAKRELLFIPEVKALHDGYGMDAIQYMLYFIAPLSPYVGMRDEHQRDKQVREAVMKEQWEPGRGVPEKLFEKPGFKLAAKAFLAVAPDIEAKQESVLSHIRTKAIEHMESLDISKATERKELMEILSTLGTLATQHRESKKALAAKIRSDNDIAVTAYDITDY